MRPRDRGAERLLARVGVAAALELVKAAAESRENLGRCKKTGPSRRELDRQREVVEPGAELATESASPASYPSAAVRAENSSVASVATSGATGYTCSPASWSRSLLVTTTVDPPASRSVATFAAAPGRRCSRLSSSRIELPAESTSIRLSSSSRPRCSGTPSASATEDSTRSGSRTDASGTHHTPSGKASRRRRPPAARGVSCRRRRAL